MRHLTQIKILTGALVTSVLIACGGGGGANSPVLSPTPGTQIVGIAATGAALVSGKVVISNTAGTSPCSELDITTNGVGSYTCTLLPGETAPFFIVVTDPTGNTSPLVSIATTTPTVGTALTVNATPLTTAIVAQLNNGDALGVVADKSKYNVTNLTAIKTNVLLQLTDVLNSIGVSSNYDPFTTNITAASSTQLGNTADHVLDVIKISKTSNNALAFSTITDATPIQMATAATAGSSVAATTSSISDLSQGAVLAAQAFNRCFALPVATRVSLSNGSITAIASECQSIVTSSNIPTDAPAFKHNGYNAYQAFYNFLTSDSMTGAKFSVPEIMAVYPAANSNQRDKAAINIRYIDNQGIPANYITVAQRFPGSSTTSRPSNWWITGNQWNYDISIQVELNKLRDFYTPEGSYYKSGLSFHVKANGSAPLASTFDSVLVTGRGLPTNGLWLVRSVSGYTDWLVISKNRLGAPQDLSSLEQVCNACVTFWMSKTNGITGTAATALSTNNSSQLNWAQAGDGAYTGAVESKRPLKGDKYIFSMYKNGALVATEFRLLATDLTSAANMNYLYWHTPGVNTVAAFDLSNSSLAGQQTRMAVDWIIDPRAEFIDSVWVSQTDGEWASAAPALLIPGTAVVTPLSSNAFFTSLNGTKSYNVQPLDGFREIDMHYRTTDDSKKVMSNVYYP